MRSPNRNDATVVQLKPKFSLDGKRIWVAGHKGMVGSALVRRLRRENCHLITASRTELDLRDQQRVAHWLGETKPQAIFLAAAHVGGILANASYPAEFIYDNLAIETNVIHGAHKVGVEKLLFLGSSCIYPKFAPQPIDERALLTGPLESTNEWYAIAKIAGLKLALAYRRQFGCDFISAMPTSLYGPEDNFDLESGHVLPALIRKAHEAKRQTREEFVVWGTGAARRELLHVDDCADALVFLMNHYSGDLHVNVGAGDDIAVAELAGLVARTVGFDGNISYDRSKPDGTPRKLVNVSRLTAMGWKPCISLPDGIASTYAWYLENCQCS